MYVEQTPFSQKTLHKRLFDYLAESQGLGFYRQGLAPASCGKGSVRSPVVRSEAAASANRDGLWACRGPMELTACVPLGSDSDGAKLTAARAGTNADGPGGRRN